MDLLEAMVSSGIPTDIAESSLGAMELAIDDVGWDRLAGRLSREFSAHGRNRMVEVCRMLAVSHPLIKRGLTIRIGYIWGQGVQVQARDPEVAEIVARFWADNEHSLSGSLAQEELERALGTDGEVFLAAFTNQTTGAVRVRSVPAPEVGEPVCNPDDRDEPWFYPRTTGRTTVYHPAITYRPSGDRPERVDGQPVRWDAPILHVPVNRLDGWQRGIPDVYASVAYARMYADFLIDWAGIARALSRFAWRMSGGNKRSAQAAAAALRAASEVQTTLPAGVPPLNGGAPLTTGQAAIGSQGMGSLEAIPKSGATIDSDSGRPLAAMIAAGLGLPVTMLLADPGVTGARATAETLDKPTVLEMTMRRMLWQSSLTTLIEYAIDQAALAPVGVLSGTVEDDGWGMEHVHLAGDTPKTLDWSWPPLDSLDPVSLIGAIVSASTTELVPDLTLLRLLLDALGVKDADEIIDSVTDEQGRLVRPAVTAGQAATEAFRRGQDPAEVV